MKKGSLIINAVLIIAVAILYVLHFKGNKPSHSTSSIAENTNPEKSVDGSNLKIMYINSDSVSEHYQLAIDLQEKFEADNKVREQKLQGKQSNLERSYRAYEKNVMTMTQRERSIEEERIQGMQQSLMQEQQELSQLAQIQQANMINEIFDSLDVFFKEYAGGQEIDLVLAYQKGSGVLYANKRFDYTNEAITAMNERYKKYRKNDSETGK